MLCLLSAKPKSVPRSHRKSKGKIATGITEVKSNGWACTADAADGRGNDKEEGSDVDDEVRRLQDVSSSAPQVTPLTVICQIHIVWPYIISLVHVCRYQLLIPIPSVYFYFVS